jgi:hypothetical protein
MKLRSLVWLIVIGFATVFLVNIATNLPTPGDQPGRRPTTQPQPETGSTEKDANEPQALLAKAYDRKKNNRYNGYNSALALLKELQRKYPDYQPDVVSAAVDEVMLAKAKYDKEQEEERAKYAKKQEEERPKREAEAKQLAEQQRLEKEQKAREKEEALAKMEAAVAKMISEGLVYSVDPSLHQVRIDPLVWITLPLETKQQTVRFFSGYFAVKEKYGLAYVTILSNRNDKVLAKMSGLSRVQILE